MTVMVPVAGVVSVVAVGTVYGSCHNNTDP